MKEYRCRISNKLLCKAEWKWEIEIKNPSNRMISYIWPDRPNNDIGLKGIDFQAKSTDLNCTKCGRLQGRAIWNLKIEIKCKYCHSINLFDTKFLKAKRLAPLPENIKNKLA